MWFLNFFLPTSFLQVVLPVYVFLQNRILRMLLFASVLFPTEYRFVERCCIHFPIHLIGFVLIEDLDLSEIRSFHVSTPLFADGLWHFELLLIHHKEFAFHFSKNNGNTYFSLGTRLRYLYHKSFCIPSLLTKDSTNLSNSMCASFCFPCLALARLSFFLADLCFDSLANFCNSRLTLTGLCETLFLLDDTFSDSQVM